jgi:invasion protein IalB
LARCLERDVFMRFLIAIAILAAAIALAIPSAQVAAQDTPGAPSQQAEAERVWPLLKDTTNITVLENFAERYKDTFYAGLARARIDELKAQAAVPAPPVAQPVPPPPLPPPLAPPPPPTYSAPPSAPPAPRPPNTAGPSPPPSNAPPPPSQQSAWVKLCEAPTSSTPDMFGKRRDVGKYTCITHHERIDGTTAVVHVAAGVRDVQGQPRRQFAVAVQAGMQAPPGMRLQFFPPDLWDKAQRNQKLEQYEEARLFVVGTPPLSCKASGCSVEIELTPDFLSRLRSNAGLLVYVIAPSGQPLAYPVPLSGFVQAFDGPPIDAARYRRARDDLIAQIRARQKQYERSKR